MSLLDTSEKFDVDSVAVIGAGPGGLAAAKLVCFFNVNARAYRSSRYLVAEQRFSKIEIFEQRDSVGGIWTYSPLNVVDDFTIPRTKPSESADAAIYVAGCDIPKFVSPVYDQLETNIPHTLMNYSDQRFPEGTPLFPAHTAVKSYLEEYAKDLRSLLSLSTQVRKINKFSDGNKKQWQIETLDLRSRVTRKSMFDAVIVASGHYNDPFIPDIPGLASFGKAYQRSISHSKFYRNPSQYRDKVRHTEPVLVTC